MISSEHKPVSVARGHTGPAGRVGRPKVGARGKDLRASDVDSEALSAFTMENMHLLGLKLPLEKQRIKIPCIGKRKLSRPFNNTETS